MNISNQSRTKSIILLSVFLSSFLISALAYAGGGRSYRSYCAWANKRYKTWGKAGEYVFLLNFQQHGHCSQAGVAHNRSHCGFDVRAGSLNQTDSWSDRWWAWAGFGYSVPTDTPADTLGYGAATFSDEVEYDEYSGTKGKIAIDNISGELKAYHGSMYSNSYRIIFWLPHNENDTTEDESQIRGEDIVWEAGVYLDTGLLKTTGHFINNMFSTTTRLDTFENPSTREEIIGNSFTISCTNLNFSIDVKDDIIDVLTNNPGLFDPARIQDIDISKLVVTISTHGGFGAYSAHLNTIKPIIRNRLTL